MTSAGTGIRHSEKCYGPKQIDFLQIWAKPNESNLRFLRRLSNSVVLMRDTAK